MRGHSSRFNEINSHTYSPQFSDLKLQLSLQINYSFFRFSLFIHKFKVEEDETERCFCHSSGAKPTWLWEMSVMHKVPVVMTTLFIQTIKGVQTTLQGIIQSSSFIRNTQNPLNSSSKLTNLTPRT